MKRRLIAIVLFAAAALWAGTIAGAYRAVRRFETTPGRAAHAPATWPATLRMPLNENGATLVMLIHPRCSCSRASISELQAILDKSPALRPYVLVYRPADAKPGWEQTETVLAASRLRRTTVVIDENGRQSRRFGGFTSGQTFVYDRAGRLRFSGGITSLRGHAGINRGRTDVIRIANSGSGDGTHPVFGCSIAERSSR